MIAHASAGSASAAQQRFQRLYETLRDRICLLDYPPGIRLGEEALAAEFHISRTPLRRVLGRLEAEGLVRSVQGVGTLVTDVDIDALTQVYELRMALAELIGSLSPVAPDAETISMFRALHERAIALSAEPDARIFARLNMDFFQTLLRLTGSEPFRNISARLYYQTSRIWLKSIPHMDLGEEIDIFSHEMADILAAVELGDLGAAGHIRRSHISMSFARLRQQDAAAC